MADPLTTEDLYGTTNSGPAAPPAVPDTSPSLAYEETPEIPMDIPAAAPEQKTSASPTPSLPPVGYLPKQQSGSGGGLGKLILFILLFVLGIWLSSYVRQFLPGNVDIPFLSAKPTPTSAPAATITTTIAPTASGSSAWKSYSVESGVTKQPVSGMNFVLPPNVLSPVCDGANCASQGTYLPGGTRFTVAARGTGQILPDFRGTAISDVNGLTFTTKPVTVSGRQGMEFTGVFTGRTVSGYAFSKMRGVMIPLTSTISVEFNHFTPTGISADFNADDILFDQIVQKASFTAPLPTAEKGAVLPTLTPLPTKTATVTATPLPSKTPTPTY